MTTRTKRTSIEKRKDELEVLKSELEIEEKRLQLDKLRREESQATAEAHENLIYSLFDEVSERSVKLAMQKLGEFSRRCPGKLIKILINSPGGLVTDGFALYDYLRFLSASGHHITTIVLGEACSMGGILLQAGDTRKMGANASLMIHEVSTGVWGKISEVEEDLALSKRLYKQCVDILASRSTLSVSEIKKRAHRKDWYLTSGEAIELGFADEVL